MMVKQPMAATKRFLVDYMSYHIELDPKENVRAKHFTEAWRDFLSGIHFHLVRLTIFDIM